MDFSKVTEFLFLSSYLQTNPAMISTSRGIDLG
jgi:hypothetical protein